MSTDECNQIIIKSIDDQDDNEVTSANTTTNNATTNTTSSGDDGARSGEKDLNNNINEKSSYLKWPLSSLDEYAHQHHHENDIIPKSYPDPNPNQKEEEEAALVVKKTLPKSSPPSLLPPALPHSQSQSQSQSSKSYNSSYVEAFSLELTTREHTFFLPNERIYVQITSHDEEPSALVVVHTNVYTIHVRHGRFSWVIKRRYKQFLRLYEAYALFKTKLNIKNVALSNYLTAQTPPQQLSSNATTSLADENSKFKPSDHFKLIFQTIASDFNQAKNILEKFLQEVVDHKTFRNHNETLKFLEVSHLSFVSQLGDKNKEGVIKKRSFNIACIFAAANVSFFWESRWLVLKDTWLGYLNPQTGLLKAVILVDQGFRVHTDADATGTRHGGLAVESLARHLIVKCHSEKRAHEWRMAILQMLFTTGQKFLAAQRFDSFAPVRDDAYCRWFVDGCDYMDSIADAIDAAREEIFITGFFLSPEIYLKRPMMVGDKWRLDKLLKRKAEEGVKIYVLIYKEIEMTLPNNSAYSKRVLALSHKNIKVLRHPDRISEPNQFLTLMWAHHEKLVIVDQSVAYFGGIDLAFGRWDNHLHKLTDLGSVLPSKVNNSQIQKSQSSNQRNTTSLTSEDNFDMMLPCEDKSVRLVNFKMREEPASTLKQQQQSQINSTNRRLRALRMLSSPSGSLEHHENQPMLNTTAKLSFQEQPSPPPPPPKSSEIWVAETTKPSRFDRFLKKSVALARSKSLEAVVDPAEKDELDREDLLNELQFPVSHRPLYYGGGNRFRSLKDRLSRSRSQTVKIVSSSSNSRRDYGELSIFNKLRKIGQFKESFKKNTDNENDSNNANNKEDEDNEDLEASSSTAWSSSAVLLRGSSKFWIGKDYCNFIYKDVKEVHSPFKDSIDRTRVPRMPWHDVAGCVMGAAARDIARHFIQRWNYVKTKKVNKNKNYPLLMPKSYQHQASFLYPPGMLSKSTRGCRVQVLRSVSSWSAGQSRTESSIHEAMKHLIMNAESYIYIENQFFVSIMDESGGVQNGIAQCLFERIMTASKTKSGFKCYVLVPLIPGYEGEYGRSSGVLLHAITHYNNASINGLIKRLSDNGVEALNYICFFSLRTWSELNGNPLTELIYVHSKLMIVDDRQCIIGSANINDRSLLGNRDSEVALLIEDTQFVDGVMNKQPTSRVGKFCGALRQRLFRELLGECQQHSGSATTTMLLSSSSNIIAAAATAAAAAAAVATNTTTNISSSSSSSINSASSTPRRQRPNESTTNGGGGDSSSTSSSSHLDLTDPCSDDFYKKVLLKYASQNTKIYDQLKEYQKAISLSQRDPNEARNELAKVKGYIVLYPNRFLCYEDLKPPLGTKEKLMPNIIWT